MALSRKRHTNSFVSNSGILFPQESFSRDLNHPNRTPPSNSNFEKRIRHCSNRTSPAQHVATEHRSSTDTSFIYCQSSTNVRVVTMEPAPRETDRSIDARHLQTSPNGGEHNRTSPYKLSAKRLIRACQCHGHRAWRTTFP